MSFFVRINKKNLTRILWMIYVCAYPLLFFVLRLQFSLETPFETLFIHYRRFEILIYALPALLIVWPVIRETMILDREDKSKTTCVGIALMVTFLLTFLSLYPNKGIGHLLLVITKEENKFLITAIKLILIMITVVVARRILTSKKAYEIAKKVFLKREKILQYGTIISGVLAVGIMIVFTAAALYSTVFADDYSFANDVGLRGFWSTTSFVDMMNATIRCTQKIYKVWQGTFTAIAVFSVFSPLNGNGQIQLSLFLAANTMLFFILIGIIIYRIFGDILLEKKYRACSFFLTFFFLFQLFRVHSWRQIFYWYTGAVVYLIPLNMFLIGLSLVLADRDRISFVLTAITSVLLFASSGGSLQITGFVCYIMLYLLVREWINRKQLPVLRFIFFISAFAGAILNVVAPGNFTRNKAYNDSGIQLISSLKNTIIVLVRELTGYLGIWTFVVFIIVFLFGFYMNGRLHVIEKDFCLSAIGLFPLAFVTVFPVVLGYNNTNISNRSRFVVYLAFTIYGMVVCFKAGVILGNHCPELIAKLNGGAIGLLCIVALLEGLIGYRLVIDDIESPMANTILVTMEAIVGGEYREHQEQVNQICQYIEQSQESDVVIYELPQEKYYLSEFKLYEDPYHWINIAVAKYYGKDSIRVEKDLKE